MSQTTTELEAILRRERASGSDVRSDGPVHMHGPGKPVRTYTQSQFVCCLLSLLESAAGAAGELKTGPTKTKLLKEVRDAVKFLEKQGIKTGLTT